MQDLAFNYESRWIGKSRIIHADCFEWLVKVPENSFHAIVTDPPYGVKEYDSDQLEKRANGNGGIWRIPASFDGHARASAAVHGLGRPGMEAVARVLSPSFPSSAWERTSRSSASRYDRRMTRSRYHIFETEYPYFMTCTIVGWAPVFTRPETFDLIYDSWRFLQREHQFQLFAYVILENHLHLIASAPELSVAMRHFKSFTARQIIDLFEERGVRVLLQQLRALKLRHKKESTYQLWQESRHPQQIKDDQMMLQKIEYIHNNPVVRGYVDDPLDWRHSSARNYAGRAGLIEVVTDWGRSSRSGASGSAFPSRAWERGEGRSLGTRAK